MSKRNEYRIQIKDIDQLTTISTTLEETGLVVETNQSNQTIIAEDAPQVGEAYRDHTKNPNGYIYWKTVKQTLQPYTNTITKIQHTLEDDTGCYRKITEYTTNKNSFTKTNQTKRHL